MFGSLFPNFDGGAHSPPGPNPPKPPPPSGDKVIIRRDGRPQPTSKNSSSASYRVIPRSDDNRTVLEATAKVALVSVSESLDLDQDLLIEKILINGEEITITKGNQVTFEHESVDPFGLEILCARSTNTVVEFDLNSRNSGEA